MIPLAKAHGLYWPNGAEAYGKRYITRADDMTAAVQRCRRRRSVVQAGGNVGAWPKWLAARFARVFTFELEAANYAALIRNVTEPNVTAVHAALGSTHGTVGVRLNGKNIGGHRVAPDGDVPVVRIDDLGLSDCDLIVLDIEGYELEAFKGAVETLARCSPVVMFEERGHVVKHGFGEEGAVAACLAGCGYRQVDTVRYDQVWARC